VSERRGPLGRARLWLDLASPRPPPPLSLPWAMAEQLRATTRRSDGHSSSRRPPRAAVSPARVASASSPAVSSPLADLRSAPSLAPAQSSSELTLLSPCRRLETYCLASSRRCAALEHSLARLEVRPSPCPSRPHPRPAADPSTPAARRRRPHLAVGRPPRVPHLGRRAREAAHGPAHGSARRPAQRSRAPSRTSTHGGRRVAGSGQGQRRRARQEHRQRRARSSHSASSSALSLALADNLELTCALWCHAARRATAPVQGQRGGPRAGRELAQLAHRCVLSPHRSLSRRVLLTQSLPRPAGFALILIAVLAALAAYFANLHHRI